MPEYQIPKSTTNINGSTEDIMIEATILTTTVKILIRFIRGDMMSQLMQLGKRLLETIPD
jgi:hypothetical protein